MTVTNKESGTNVHEVADGIYRINTPVTEGVPGGFSFNQYLLVDDEPLLFHTGPRRMFPLVREAVASVMPVEDLRYIALSHFEADECGSLNEWLAAAPNALPLCGTIAALVSINDIADRPPRALADGETLSLGTHTFRWFDSPHLPHGWDCGYLMEESTQTLLCGDLFTQGGADLPALTEANILGPSEGFRRAMDYFSHTKNIRATLARHAGAVGRHPASQRRWRVCTAMRGVVMVQTYYALLPMAVRVTYTPLAPLPWPVVRTLPPNGSVNSKNLIS